MKPPLPWLPANCLRSKRAAKPFADAVAAWSKSWFVRTGWTATDAFQSAGHSEWPMLREEGAFQLRGKPKAMLDLAFAVLDQKPRQDLTAADLRLLRRLASRAIDDLLTRVEAAIPAAAAHADVPGRTRPWQLAIGLTGQPTLALVLDEPVLVAAARAAYSPTKQREVLSSPRDAVRDMEVPLSGHVGSAQLAIEQIDALEVGDILLLDEKAGSPARLTIAGKPSDLFFAIDDSGDRLTLTLQE